MDTVTRTNLRCLKCDTTFERHVGAIFNNNARCPTCFPPWAPWANKTSAWQQEVADFMATLVTDVEINNRVVIAPLELDVYVPSHKFAIECNGLYWHSEAVGQFDKGHTERKRLQAQAMGVSLFTLFEDEWRDKRRIVEAMIVHRLGKSAKVGARKLRLVRCPQFGVALLNGWHLEGHVNSSYATRLETKDGHVMGICSLRWARGTNCEALEVARMAFLPGTHVQGGVGKFINDAAKYARELGAKRLISYSDNRLGDGSGYAAAGMKFEKTTTQRFWWTDFNRRYDRFTYRADKSKGLTERQVAANAGVSRIYGCSNSLWSIDL